MAQTNVTGMIDSYLMTGGSEIVISRKFNTIGA